MLTLPELAFVMTKHHGTRLGFAVLLVFFRNQGRFPRTAREIDAVFVEAIARQLAITAPPDFAPILTGRTAERHRAEIRELTGFREATVADGALLEDYLIATAARRAGLPPVHPHLLRHSCGFYFANRGYDLRLIQDYLGHRDPKHTVHYTRVAGSRFEGLWR